MSSNNEFESISFDLPKNQSNVIKVIGVGGGGSNAINHMFQQGIKGVDFVICNTDSQALQNSGVPNKIQLGVHLTEGLGAGANPTVGEQSAVESYEEIKRMLDANTKMVFITAGMGGGTGTGAAPVIAKMAKDMDILTVGIVTIPFKFEGKMRNEQAQIGIEKLRKEVDSLIVINNNNLREVYGNLGFKAGFSKADEVLATASRGIAEVITHHYTQNIDLRDAKTVLSNSGTAIMGSATSDGPNRALEAITKALDSPLLNDNKITGAKNVLLLIVSGSSEITIDEIGEINDHIQDEAGNGANIIMGVGEEDGLGESISVTIVATGFDVEQQNEITNTETKKVVHSLDGKNETPKIEVIKPEAPVVSETPVFVEKKSEVVIKHTLDLDEDFDIVNVSSKTSVQPQAEIKEEAELEMIPTSELIKNIDVVYEDVSINAEDLNDFVITSTQEDIVVNEIEDDEEQQITLSFDLPFSNDLEFEEVKTEVNLEETVDVVEEIVENQVIQPVIHQLTEDEEQIEVKDEIEIIPVTETTDSGEIRYALDNYETKESLINSVDEVGDLEEEVLFETKTVVGALVSETENEIVEENIDPLHTPISELLKSRAEERRQKMKLFNYKFNNSKIDDIEKIPAYKRQGLNIEEGQHSSDNNVSKTMLGTDDNDDIQLRSNNSFLHDNVD
ncbi:cell division protein FtsZ [Aurantibacter sp.]|uniref:cell division protein FtsZ n=1 Tax=Aurantibacter sp. TaxID=2807103 RepID=UPI0035C79EB1